jgi:hypothetical protein
MAGVEFVDENGGGPGVRLRKRQRANTVQMKGRGAVARIARVRLPDGSIHLGEVHWYEASGIGRKEFKIKRLL